MTKTLACPDCGKQMEQRIADYVGETKFGTIRIPDLVSDICADCDEEWYSPSSAHRMEEAMEALKKSQA